MKSRDKIFSGLVEIIKKVEPDVVVTWGPDGVTGHSDHRITGLLTTELLQHVAPSSKTPRKLYYVTFPASKFEKPVPPFGKDLLTTADAWITTVVDCRDGLPEARKAALCYKSQHTPDISGQISDLLEKVLEGRMYLRRVLGAGAFEGKERDLFEGIK
jgi:LmbE family N-acetylglucosaminyl deacetylase